MRWVIKQTDLDRIKEEHGSAQSTVGYADEHKLLNIPIPKMYAVLVDDNELKLIQLNMNMEVKNIDTIPVSSIEAIKISGAIIKKVVVTTNGTKIKLAVKTLAVGIQNAQKEMLTKLGSLAK
ncbi:hypothetical protein [Tetragenococcus solitarius]|uniref:YokE-like PH domain-containing protein n=1 Tax=Tetragenococcus solitarius TaxID=71453 RepID=A0ABN3YEV8_9ENTE|nr:hypothetical protein [Tetragenococcus solitarius]